MILYNKEALTMVNIAFYVYLLKDFSIRTLAFTNLFVFVTGFSIMIILKELNIISIHEEVLYLTGKGAAHTYGFANPNGFGGFVFAVIVNIYILISGLKRNFFLVLLLLLIAVISYNYCLARTSLIGSLVLVLTHFAVKLKLIRRWMRYGLAILPVIFFVLMLYFTFFLSDYMYIDIIASGRLTIYSEILGMMTKLNWLIGIPLPDGPMDGSLWMLLFTGGIGYLSFFFISYYKSVVNCFEEIYPYFPVLLAILIGGLVENIFSGVSGISVIFWLLACRYYTEKRLTE